MLFNERSLPKLIIITPLLLVAIITTFITSFYSERIESFVQEDSQSLIKEYIQTQKTKSESLVKQLILMFDYTHSKIEQNIKLKLKERVDLAHSSATFIYNKYHEKEASWIIKERIVDALSQMIYYRKNYVWITDYEANNILSDNKELQGRNLSTFKDADGRNIILEEIQKVRHDKEGYITTRFRKGDSKQIMFVKDFGHYDWFFGMGLHINYALNELKSRLLAMVQSYPVEANSFLAIFDKREMIYANHMPDKAFEKRLFERSIASYQGKPLWINVDINGTMYYLDYYAPFGWYVVHGFSNTYFQEGLQKRKELFEAEIDQEVNYITYASVVMGVLVALLSLIFSKRIVDIFRAYRERVASKEEALKALNASLEERVHKEVEAHQAKDKMMVQQAKMAAMGDMLSMIAHQWRQPLNQMSYIFMNIEGAYEYNELTKEYLDEKLKEGTNLLEFMSHTIDDFRDFFKPDKAREMHHIDEVMQSAISLIQKSLDIHNITLKRSFTCSSELLVYRNELVQVLLNILSNAKDALIEREVQEPLIFVELRESQEGVIIDISDNAGGVAIEDEKKIFDPYFTTKSAAQGTGLGLYMAKMILTEHLDASLTLINSEHGATFEIKFKHPHKD